MSLQDAKLLLTPNAYKASKLYAIKPIDGTGDATVTRNTTKTRVNSSGLIESMANNVLAPDYLNTDCPALNVEGQATNLVTFSNDFANAAWEKTGLTVTSNTDISPDGTMNAATIENTATNVRFLRQDKSLTAGQIYNSFAFFKKKDTFNYVQVGYADESVFASQIFNINTGQIESAVGDGTIDDAKIIPLANSWYMCAITFTSSSTGAGQARYSVAEDFNDINFSSSGFKTLIYGAQFTEGSEATSYIPTTTAQVTRSADTLTIPIPSGTTEIIEKYEDGTTNTITTIPASPYTVPTGKRYEYILMR